MISKEELIQSSMTMILHSGDARTAIMKAYDLLEDDKIQEADDLLEEAKELLNKAHQMQTSIVQFEASGEEIPYSPLFSHAQDTMMTVQTEYTLSKRIFGLYKKILKG